jgi:hypothetical protein
MVRSGRGHEMTGGMTVGDGENWGPPPGPPPADDYFSLGPPLPPLPPLLPLPPTEGDAPVSLVVDSGMGGGRRSNRGRAVRPAVVAALAVGVLTIVGVSVSAAESSGPAASRSWR